MSQPYRDARADLFPPGTEMPTRRLTLNHPGAGKSVRDLAEALFDGDLAMAHRLLAADPDLARARIGEGGDVLAIAVATGSISAIDLLLGYGATPAGLDGAALELAIVAHDLGMAQRLLEMGAWQQVHREPAGSLLAAASANAIEAVRLLLRYGASASAKRADGTPVLLMALYMETFRIAEVLLDHGADAWMIDATGGNLGTAVTEVMQTDDLEEAAAQHRLAQRALTLGWPDPAPTPAQVRALAVVGHWPPLDGIRPN